MTKYQTPETRCLNMQAQSMICETSSAPAPTPGRSGKLGTMTVKAVNSWT